MKTTTVTSDRLKTALLFVILPGSCLVAETLGILSVPLLFAPPSQAADFAHAKQIIVPSSRIRRRYDSDVRETSSYSMNPNNGSAVDGYYSGGGLSPAPLPYNISAPSYSSGSSGVKSKNGLIPPPPAVTPSIVAPPMGMMSPMSQPTATASRYDLNASQSQAVSPHAAHAAAQLDSLLKEGKFTEAQALIKNYTKAFPKDKSLRQEFVQTLLNNGKAQVAAKDYDEAVKLAREALALEPASTPASNALNEWLKKKGVDHTSDVARLKMADTLAREGKYNEALVEYRAALKIKPSADGHIGVGAMLFKEGKKESAKGEFQKALELDPNSSAALRHLGSLRYTQGDVIGANNDLSRALIINPEDKVASRTLIDLWHRQVAKNPRDASQHLGLARAYQLSGDLKSSQNEYKQVVRLEPDNPNLPAARQSFKLALARQEAMKAYQAAQTLDQSGAIRDAHSKIVEAAGIAPTDVKIRLYEGDLATRLGLYSQAHDAYMTVIREEPKNTLAAKKLQELNAKMQATTMIMPNSAPQAGGLASPQVISFLNQQPGAQPALLSQLTSQVRPGELPPAPTIPRAVPGAGAPTAPVDSALPTDNHVSSLSGFLGQLRGFQQSEKERMTKFEDAAQKALGTGSGAGSSAGSGLGLPPLPPLPPLPTVLTTETPVTVSASALSTPAPSTVSALGAPAPAPAPAAGIDGNTLATLARNAFPNGISSANIQAAAQALPGLMQQAQTTLQNYAPPANQINGQRDLSPAPTVAFNSSSLPVPAPPAIASATPAEAPKPQLLPEISPVPQAAPDYIRKKAQSMVSPEMLSTMPQLPDNIQKEMVKGMSADQISAIKQAMAANANNSRGSVRFELEGVVPSKSQIKLKVVLKNDRDFPMELPPTVSAKIQMPGKPEQTAKVEFSGKQINAHGEIHGIIKVPGRDLNASADVYLPNFLPPSEQYRDVHLTVPISKL
ncbi:MAG TPA: tetratricopeptide repeat protein [Candidatus Melainabacteria bacterium]|nr:tetratricopeptide repeat protein [Candidatus Melainabacteria bacterium]